MARTLLYKGKPYPILEETDTDYKISIGEIPLLIEKDYPNIQVISSETIHEALVRQFDSLLTQRDEKGIATYGTTLDEASDDDYSWSMMMLEEMLDLVQYQQKEIRRLRTLLKGQHIDIRV